jgi:hypothetical protein
MAGGGAAPPPKQEELQPHPVKDQLPSVSYCITSPPPWRTSLSISLTSPGIGTSRFQCWSGTTLCTDVDVFPHGRCVDTDSGPDLYSTRLFLTCFLSPDLEHAAEAVILGFQHYIVMLGTSVIIPSALVPQMGGGNVSKPITSTCSESKI